MANHPDACILADKVIFLLRTKYRDWKSRDLPFHAAFFELADKYKIPGEERYPLMQEIGRILARRPRRVQRPTECAKRMPKIQFVVGSKDRAEIVLLSPMMGDTITLRRDKDGKAVWHSFTGNHTQVALSAAVEYADELFTELDDIALQASTIKIVCKNDDEIALQFGDGYRMLITRGTRGKIRSVIFCGEREVKQKEAPTAFIADAKAIARTYFKDTRTGDLFPLR